MSNDESSGPKLPANGNDTVQCMGCQAEFHRADVVRAIEGLPEGVGPAKPCPSCGAKRWTLVKHADETLAAFNGPSETH
jgi:hypothetical protein